MIGIYKITNPLGQIYVGGSKNIKKRFRNYKYLNCRFQRRLYDSFAKYGLEKHIFEVLEECEYSEIKTRERYWQEFYECIDLQKGLNCILQE